MKNFQRRIGTIEKRLGGGIEMIDGESLKQTLQMIGIDSSRIEEGKMYENPFKEALEHVLRNEQGFPFVKKAGRKEIL